MNNILDYVKPLVDEIYDREPVLLVASAFLVGAILNNLLISTLNGQPIHWF